MKVTGDGEDGFDALPAHRVVDVAKVFARIFDFGFLDDERSADLLDALVQLDRLLGPAPLHVLVPPVTPRNNIY